MHETGTAGAYQELLGGESRRPGLRTARATLQTAKRSSSHLRAPATVLCRSTCGPWCRRQRKAVPPGTAILILNLIFGWSMADSNRRPLACQRNGSRYAACSPPRSAVPECGLVSAQSACLRQRASGLVVKLVVKRSRSGRNDSPLSLVTRGPVASVCLGAAQRDGPDRRALDEASASSSTVESVR